VSARVAPGALAFFLPSVVVLTVASGLLFVGLQQDLRQGADYPQIQLAEDLARHLDTRPDPSGLALGPSVDLATSLAPFEAVYDSTGRVIATNGTLDGTPPQPPIGVLDTARSAGVDRVTWQPRAGLRFALYAVRWSGGSVVAGRSLRIVEERVNQLQALIAIGWFVGLVLLAGVSIVAARLLRSDT
jgi:hypothetical protein